MNLRDAAQATLAKIDELDRQLQWEHSLSIKDEREFKDLRTALAADKAQDAQQCEDKDPFYCWCVRCQLALMCKNKQPTEQTAQPCPDCGAQGDQDGTR